MTRKQTPLLIAAIAILLFGIANTIPEITVKHTFYTTHFNPATLEPDSVSWNLTVDMVSCAMPLQRTNDFIPDPQISQTKGEPAMYEGSGYDQGHQMSAQDNACKPVGAKECWYMGNMVPQCPELNRVTWLGLETWCRKEAHTANLHIVCGVIGSIGNVIEVHKVKGGPNVVIHTHLNIPAICYKCVYENGKWTVYEMPNIPSVKSKPWTWYAYHHNTVKGKDVATPYTIADIYKDANLKL